LIGTTAPQTETARREKGGHNLYLWLVFELQPDLVEVRQRVLHLELVLSLLCLSGLVGLGRECSSRGVRCRSLGKPTGRRGLASGSVVRGCSVHCHLFREPLAVTIGLRSSGSGSILLSNRRLLIRPAVGSVAPAVLDRHFWRAFFVLVLVIVGNLGRRRGTVCCWWVHWCSGSGFHRHVRLGSGSTSIGGLFDRRGHCRLLCR
jgi:hypothetical protein